MGCPGAPHMGSGLTLRQGDTTQQPHMAASVGPISNIKCTSHPINLTTTCTAGSHPPPSFKLHTKKPIEPNPRVDHIYMLGLFLLSYIVMNMLDITRSTKF